MKTKITTIMLGLALAPLSRRGVGVRFLSLFLLTSFGGVRLGLAQTIDPKAYNLLEKAFAGLGTKQSYAMYFETIALEVAKPAEVFNLPLYKVFKGGHLIINGAKFEMNLGVVKALCDGKVMVMTNELIHTMVIDSIRQYAEKQETQKFLDKWIGENLKEGKLSYQGLEKLSGKNCHKIRNDFEDGTHSHVLYWVAEDTGLLYMMAEKQQNTYNVYVIKKITEAPASHSFAIKALPAKAIEHLKGYEVMDMRFARVIK